MAFTKSPTMDTYSSETIDLTREISSRAGNVADKDEDFVNVFLEDVRSKYASDKRSFICKRAGTSLAIPSVVSGLVRGVHYWADKNKLYYAVGSTLYIRNVSLGTTTTMTSFFGGTVGDVGFADYIYDDGTAKLVISDGTSLYTLDNANTKVTVTDGDLPSPHDPHIVFLDGYIFLLKTGTGDIYGCEANDPTSWDPTNILSAEIEADSLVRLHKINNYLVGFGKTSIEYFWDAGIATGSPLQRNEAPIKRITYLTGLAQEQNQTYFVGKDLNGRVCVYKMMDFKCDDVSTLSISRYLNALTSDYHTWYAGLVSFFGHCFYVINAGTRTYCLDCSTGIWTRLAFQTGTTFPLLYSVNITSPLTATLGYFFLNDNTTNLYLFDDTLYQDAGTTFPCVIVTESSDFGTLNRKNMHRLSLYADRPPADADILIQWTDDDYQTYNTGVLCNLTQDLACIYQLGSFRQRSFKLTFTEDALLRLQNMVADINKGTS